MRKTVSQCKQTQLNLNPNKIVTEVPLSKQDQKTELN